MRTFLAAARRTALVATTIVAGAVSVISAADASATADSSPTARIEQVRAMSPATYERRVQVWVNRRREVRDLAPVGAGACADGIAESWSTFLGRNLEFYHQDLSPFFDRCGAQYAGETLARGAVSPRETVRLWMHSEGHRHILLSEHPNRVGIGAYQDSRGDWVVAADFIRR